MAAFLRLTRELINLFEVSGVSMTNERVTAIREELDPLMGSNLPRETSQSVTNAFVEVLARGDSAIFEILRSLGGHCASLPSHCSSWEEIDAMIAQTAKAVEGLCQGKGEEHGMSRSLRLIRKPFFSQTYVQHTDVHHQSCFWLVPCVTGTRLRALEMLSRCAL